MRIGIVGAGLAGIAAARAFRASGADVAVFEAATGIGGVWGPTRSYPGISIQNDKHIYAFSDKAMPEGYPDYPAGALVQQYLEEFVEDHHLSEVIHLESVVSAAEPSPDGGGWTFDVTDRQGRHRESVDWLIVANGTFAVPHVPDWPGRAEFEAAGGTVVPPARLGAAEVLDGKDVVVVGFGKSACDVAAAAVGRATAVTVVARNISLKLPRRIRGVPHQRIMMSRLGEHLLWATHRTPAGLALRYASWPVRKVFRWRFKAALLQEMDLARRGLLPSTPAYDLESSVTEGFFEAVDEGRIAIRRDMRVTRLTVVDGRPSVVLGDGAIVPADVVVAATGFEQSLDLLAPAAREQILEPDGDLWLYRRMLPTRLDRIAFAGWAGSYLSVTSSELQALWLTALVHGELDLPSPERRRQLARRYPLTHARASARGLPLLPGNGSLMEWDEWIADLRLRLPVRDRLQQLVRPVQAASYRHLLPLLVARIERRHKRSGSTSDGPAEPVQTARSGVRRDLSETS
jgi:cation diffusion facilitator CzcD-associated flavoprotein CzcO